MENLPTRKGTFGLALYLMISYSTMYAIHQTLRNSVLVMFLVDSLGMSLAESKIIFHGGVLALGLMMPFTSAVADGYLGNFRQFIFHFFILFGSGYILTLSSIPGWFFHSAVGAGLGVLVCSLYAAVYISVHYPLSADQLKLPEENNVLSKFFMFDYWTFNIGATVGTLISPVLRRDTGICPTRNCFQLCFGLSFSLLAATAGVILVFSKAFVKKKPLRTNVVWKCMKASWYAINKKLKTKEKREHWLDHADDKYEKTFISDLKKLKLLCILFPMPVFWAMYSQEESSWVFQARRMNGDLGFYTIPPDQMYVFNPVFCVILIPIFEYGIYPFFARYNMLKTSLQRICVGVLFFLVSYAMSGYLVYKLEERDPPIPEENECFLHIYNPNSCTLKVQTAQFSIEVSEMGHEGIPTSLEDGETMAVNVSCGKVSSESTIELVEKEHVGVFMVKNGTLLSFKDNVYKSANGNPLVRVLSNSDKDLDCFFKLHESIEKLNTANYEQDLELGPADYKVYIGNDETTKKYGFYQGGVYVMLVNDQGSDKYVYESLEITTSNTMHMLWMIPQYLFAVVAEVMFAVSSNEFAYAEAPLSMKSCIQAFFYLTKSMGNLLIMVVEAILPFKRLSLNILTYIVITGLASAAFIWLSIKYKYVVHLEEEKMEESR